MGGSSGGSTQSQSNTPWSGQEPWLNQGSNQVWYTPNGQGGTNTQTGNIAGLFPRAYDILQSSKPNYFPGATVAGFTPDQSNALAATRNIAMGPNPLTSGAYNAAAGYAAGDFSNPAIQGALDATRRSVQPAIDSRFMQSGRSFSPAHAQALGQGISDATAPIIFGAQQNAMNQAPELSAARYGDPNALYAAGTQQQGQNQALINSDIERFNADQLKDIMKLEQYGRLVSGNYGGTSLTTGQQNISAGPLGWMSGVGSALGGVGSLGQGLPGIKGKR